MSEAPNDDRTMLSHGEGEVGVAHETLPAGEVVAGYRVEGLAGAGGMGVVYRASDPELGRTVALKLIAPERAGDARLRELFVRESLTAARLEHPNIIPIYRAGEDGGRLFIAMRFVEGASLEELIAESRGGIPPGRAARIVARVADALDAAHARGLVHRDVKPANVLIADPGGDEHVYLTDFGLSVTSAGRAHSGQGGWAGTLAYLAPEQIEGGRLDARSDVYALGCVLFHALTGRPPFPADDERATLDAHLSQPPPAPSSVVAGLPPAMDEVVRRAMAKRPEDRFASAGELGRAALAARYDVALLAEGEDRAARQIAGGLAEAGLTALVTAAGGAATAEGVRASGACAVLVGRGGLGDWARAGLSAARELAARDRAFRLVLILLPGAPDPADPSLSYLATHPWVDLRAETSDALGVDDLVRALRGADVAPGLSAESGECPYRGLEAFREEDTGLFFGREQDAALLIERLRSTRFLAVLGPSGSGKSSLVQAGLLPAVRSGVIPGGEAWRLVELIPGEHPLAGLAGRLGKVAGAGTPSPADLAADERALDLATARALEGRPALERVLVVVDQFEEAFTLCADEGERAAFLGNLVYAATIPGGRTVVVLAMRADFYHRLAEHPELRALVSARQLLVGPMEARALRRAIEEPARGAGLDLEPGLTRRILTDVADRPGTLPLLEHLLLELWQRRRGRTLTLEAYAASGGVEGALARRANDVYGAMSPERQAVARRILLRLTQPGEGTEDTRRRAARSELVTRPEEEAEVAAVVDSLAAARLITAGRDEVTDEPVVEVTHEALIRGWPELRAWIDDDREALRLHRRLTEASGEWSSGGREAAALYRGARLSLWEGRDLGTLNRTEREFLSASRERAAAERTKRRRRVKLALAGLAATLVAVSALAIFALIQRSNASTQRDVALSRQIAASSREQLSADPELSLLLARDAYAVAPTAQAEQALRASVAESRVRFSYAGDGKPIHALAVRPDGSLAASAGDSGRVHLWDPAKPDQPGRVLTGHDGAVLSLAFSGDGALLASGGADGTVRTWDVDRGVQLIARKAGVTPIRSVALSADGSVLAAGGDDLLVRVWRGSSPGDPRLLRGAAARINGVAVSPDGARIASGTGDPARFVASEAVVWDTSRDSPLRRFADNFGPVTAVGFADGGQTLLVSSQDNTVKIYDLTSRREVTSLDARGTSLYDFAVDPLAEVVAAGAGDGSVHLWSLGGGDEILTLPGHRGSVTGVAFVAGSHLLLSASSDGTVRGWDWRAGQPQRLPAKDIAAAALPGARDPELIHFTGALTGWRPGAGTRTSILEAPPSAVAAEVNPEGHVAVASADGRIVVTRRSPTGAVETVETSTATGNPTDIFSLTLSRDGRRLAVEGLAGEILLWDTSRPRARRVLRGAGPPFAALAVAPDGALAAGFSDGILRRWTADGQSAGAEDLGSGPISQLDFSPDGGWLAVGTKNGIALVKALDGSAAPIHLRHGGNVGGLAFSSDGRLLATTGGDAIGVWDWRRGVLLRRWIVQGALYARVDAGGERVVVVENSGGGELLACDVCGSTSSVLALSDERRTRDLSPEERAEFAPR